MYICSVNARWRGHRDSGLGTLRLGALNRQSDLKSLALLTHKRPVDSDDALFRKAFQRFRKNEISDVPAFFKTDDPKLGSAFALQNCHHTIFLDLRLKVPVSGRFLPQCVHLRLAAVLDYLREPRCFGFKKFHETTLNGAPGGRDQKKPARELRQEGSYYRCCIPALAGFASPQSIAPDGEEISLHRRPAQLETHREPRGRWLSASRISVLAALATARHRDPLTER